VFNGADLLECPSQFNWGILSAYGPCSGSWRKSAADTTPSRLAKTPRRGKPYGRTSAYAIGRNAAGRKPAARAIAMNASTGWRAMMRSSADINPFLACRHETGLVWRWNLLRP
jgi:hypothetical protein